MLRCRRVVQLLGDLVSGDLPAGCRERVQEHLGSCPCCAAAERSYRAVIDLGHRLPPLALPPGMLERLRQRAEAASINLPPATTPG